MFGLGAPEMLAILVVALVVFGPRKLPELGKSLGQGIREFRKGTRGLQADLEESLQEDTASPLAPPTEPVHASKVTR